MIYGIPSSIQRVILYYSEGDLRMGDSYHDYNTLDGLLDDIIHNVNDVTTENTKKVLREVLHDDFKTCDFDYVGTYKAVLDLLENLNRYMNIEDLENELLRIRDDIAPCCCSECLENDPVAKEVYKDKI